jgi:glutamine synthetase
MTPRDVIDLATEHEAKILDVRFVDMPGTWHHLSIPISSLTEDLFEDGIGFDGSSIRGFQAINESDMLLVPDPSTAFVDPFTEEPTIVIIADVEDPITRERYSRDPRNVAKKAEAYLKSTGIADTVYFGPEAEFFIFNDVRYDTNSHSGYYFLDSDEGIWNSGRDEKPNLGYKVRYKGGYYPVPPTDSHQDLRTQMMLTLGDVGIETEVHHHEVGTAGQSEIGMKFGPLLDCADALMKFKYVIKNVAVQNGYTATFMPKPLFQDNGSGMHCHQSLWKAGVNMMYDERGYAGLSETAIYYIGGILKHAASILALAAPTTNSYRRLVPGYEAPINLIYSQRNRSACVRIPMYSKSAKAKRIEFRAPDPTCNPYLAFPAMMLAGLDGIENKILPPEPIDRDLYEMEPEERHGIKMTPGSLAEALDALEADHEYLLKGGVFTPDLISTYIAYKRLNECDAVALRPHPHEFHLYYDA